MTRDDYRRLGVMAALDVITTIIFNRKVCVSGLGGTILAIAAATTARDGDDRIASLTLLASQTDFAEAGELMLFLDERHVMLLDDLSGTRAIWTALKWFGRSRRCGPTS